MTAQPPITLVFRLNAMGDILLTVPTLHALAEAGNQVHLVINKKWAALAPFLPATVHYFDGAASLLPLVRRLQRLAPAQIIDLQGKASTLIMRNLLQAPVKRAYTKRTLAEQLQAARGAYPIILADPLPIWEKYARVCQVTAAPNPALNLSASYLAECRELVQSLGLTEKRFVFIHPDASKPGKTISEQLLGELVANIALPVGIIGTSSQPLKVVEGLGKCLDLRNKIGLRHLPGVMSLAAAVISSDSGPMHLARAVNVPLIALFFQTDPSLGFAPVPSKQTRVISVPLPCKPCSLHGQNEKCPEGHFNCKNIKATQVLNELELLFGELV